MNETQVLDALVQALAPRLEQYKARQFGYGEKHDAPGAPITAGYTHGPGGVLTFPGVDPVMFHTVMGAYSLLSQLPATGSLYTDPTYYTITGVRADTGSEKDGVCDNAPVAGLMKACLVHSVFGRYERSTQELEINRVGQRIDRADPLDLRLIGTPLAQTGIFGNGPQDPATPADLFTNEVARKFWERNVSFHRLLSRQLWRGNPANNSAGGGSKELTSIPILVNTGYVDAETGQACAAMDSVIKGFSYTRVDSNCAAIVAALTDMYYQVKDRAIRTGVMPVRWAFAMRPQLFYELTACWPCSYLTYKCQLADNQRINIDGQDAVRFRDEMRAGRYLLIDGERVDVIVDDGIPENTNTDNANVPSGCFGTDIYLLPFSVIGGQSVLYMEYFQYQNPAVQEALGQMVLGRIEGAFITWPRQTNLCVQWQSKIEPRLVLRTPWLAGRLTNVVYCPAQHTREAFPEDPYFTDGGKVSRPGPSFHDIWNVQRD